MTKRERAAQLIKDCEDCSLVPYLCSSDVATIGWGHTIVHQGKQLRGEQGLAIARALYPRGITQEAADGLLLCDLEHACRTVERSVKVPLTDNQYAALVSFVYNVGIGSFLLSTLLRKLNAGDYQGAAAEFPRWNKSLGRVMAGLVTRRAKEQALFLS